MPSAGRKAEPLPDPPWSVPQVITYSGHHVYDNLTEEQKGRVAFASNFLAGDASLQIASLQPRDEGLYTCKVKNSGRYVWSHVVLKVLGKASGQGTAKAIAVLQNVLLSTAI